MKRFKNHAKLSQSIVHGVLAICFATIGLHAQLQLVSAAAPLAPPEQGPQTPPSPGVYEPHPCSTVEVQIDTPIEVAPFPFPFPFPGPDEVGLGPEGLGSLGYDTFENPEVLSAAYPGPDLELNPCWPSNPQPVTLNIFLPFVNR